MTTDYKKWDNLEDSDDEHEQTEREVASRVQEEKEVLLEDQDDIEKWLQRQEESLRRYHAKSQYDGVAVDMARKSFTKEERRALAMFISVVHFEDGETNLERYSQMFEVMTHNRWLEDPSVVEFMCRAHNYAMRLGQHGREENMTEEELALEDSDDQVRVRKMVFSGINALAAPRLAHRTGGLLEMVQSIATPQSDEARAQRVKWQSKDYATEACMRSIFPRYQDKLKEDQIMDEKWVGPLMLLMFVVLFVVVYFTGKWVETATKKNRHVGNEMEVPIVDAISGNDLTSVTSLSGPTAVSSVEGAASAAGVAEDSSFDAVNAAEASERKLEDLQRQLEDLKRAQAVQADEL